MEKRALFLVLLLIILVASLNIISSLLMTVMSRRSEIGLLRTLGATREEIRNIFFKLGCPYRYIPGKLIWPGWFLNWGFGWNYWVNLKAPFWFYYSSSSKRIV